MPGVINALLPLAFAIALGPVPILAIVSMLRTASPSAASIGFTLGWLMGMLIATAVLVTLSSLVPEGEADHPRHWLGVVQLVLGSALLLLAGKKISSRPRPGTEVEMPKFLASLTNTTPRRSVKVGFALATLNPKHVVFMLPVGTLAVERGLALLEVALVILIFSLLASISVAAPTVMHLLAPERLRRVIDPPFRWMVRNMNWVSAAILTFIGTNTIGKGVGNL